MVYRRWLREGKAFLAGAYRVLKPDKLFIISSMCGTIEYLKWQKKVDYDPVSRCTITKGIATRYIGLVDDIISEVKTQGFKILDCSKEQI